MLPESRRRRTAWRVVVPLSIAAAVTVGAVGWAAASQSSTPTPAPTASASPSSDHPWWNGRWKGGWGGSGWGGGWYRGFDRALHGEFVVAKEGGGTETMLMQRGSVTEVSETSISLKSSDGYTKSYAVTKDTQIVSDQDGMKSFAKGEEVVVCALNGTPPAAVNVINLTDLKD